MIPKLGLGVGGGLFAFTTVFNCTIPTRAVLTVLPIVIDYMRISSDAGNESRTADFLNWVVGYRKAKCFAERNRDMFVNE